MYPENDTEFEDRIITEVTESDDHHSIGTNGWWMQVSKASGVVPKVGQNARFYPQGIGRSVRGLFIDGVKVWYRTDAEDKEYREVELYGADAGEWLKRWDEGRGVWTIEMGGLGPGYEQCIHITAAEIIRYFLAEKHDSSLWIDKDIWKQVRDKMEPVVLEIPVVKNLGLSGAQWGAAVSIASAIYMRGPREIMTDKATKDRHIQVSKNFPAAA